MPIVLYQTLCDLCPDERTFEIINKAYNDGLIYSVIVGFEEFEESMDLGVDIYLDRIKHDIQLAVPEDIHDAMSWWACFEENEQKIDQLFSSTLNKSSSISRKKKKKKKRK